MISFALPNLWELKFEKSERNAYPTSDRKTDSKRENTTAKFTKRKIKVNNKTNKMEMRRNEI